MGNSDVVSNAFEIEDAGSRSFVDAIGTGTSTSQLPDRVVTGRFVAPANFQKSFGTI
jgi:hypothetical protein